MEFGMFHEFPCRPGRSDAEIFAEGFDLVDAAEQWGLDVIWLAELHVNPTRSVLAAPLTVATAIAARTQRIKVGTGVQVLPLGHPLRLAEEVATVDHVSQGRLIFGVGRSGFARTYEAYGIPYVESKERFNEALDIMIKAWTEPQTSFHGQYFNHDNISVMPRPYQQPHPEIRVAANTADTYPQMGTAGYPIFVAVRLGTFSDLRPNIKAYRDAWRAAGHPGDGRVYIRVPVYISDTPEHAQTEPEDSLTQFYRGFANTLAVSAERPGTNTSQRAEIAAQIARLTYPDILREKVIVGTVDGVAERLAEIKADLGLNGILAEMNCGSRIPHENVRRSLRLLCKEVMPRFK
jgi:alkanesulfonate monooxygenase SsuD/methylene tetrahydromethanopterin reductase-like flavin-dependent oxidoreductase (luciferase family)